MKEMEEVLYDLSGGKSSGADGFFKEFFIWGGSYISGDERSNGTDKEGRIYGESV